ncbi:MAG: MobA/MobL family protein [Verrucomicrobiota bacterium]
MANFHCQIRPIQRSKRRSVIQLVSYVTGLKLRSLRTGRRYRRRTPGDVIRFACVGSNLPMQALWQKAESAERRKNSIEGRHQIVALPRENSQEEQWKMLVAMAEVINRLLGVPVVVALHDNAGEPDKPRNPHGHLIFATRVWNERAKSFQGKTRALDVANTGSVIIESLRKTWEDIINAGLPAGVSKVSRLSHARAGRSRIPRRHLGEQATELELKGIRTRSGNFNRRIDQLDRVAAQQIKVENEMNAPSMMSRSDRQRQLGLERQLAIADALIAEFPPMRRNPPANILVVAKETDQSETEKTTGAGSERKEKPRASNSHIIDQMPAQNGDGTQRSEVFEGGGLAIPSQLLPLSLEEELRLASEAIDGATRPEKDLLPPS